MKFVFVVESDKEIFYSLSYFSISIRTLLVPYLGTSDLGCHFKGVYIGCIVYADDILLISASVVQLQQMLHLCSSCADEMIWILILTIRNLI